MWTLPNIGQKVNEIVPTFANFYAASAVPFVVIIVGIVAASMHGTPNEIKWMWLSSLSVSVSMVAFPATARSSRAISKMTNTNSRSVATIAMTKPEYASTFISAS